MRDRVEIRVAVGVGVRAGGRVGVRAVRSPEVCTVLYRT